MPMLKCLIMRRVFLTLALKSEQKTVCKNWFIAGSIFVTLTTLCNINSFSIHVGVGLDKNDNKIEKQKTLILCS